MGRGFELFYILTTKNLPSQGALRNQLTHLSITPELMKLRRQWIKNDNNEPESRQKIPPKKSKTSNGKRLIKRKFGQHIK